MAERKTFKALNFDLDTNALGAYFNDYTQAYAKLRKDLKREGWEHRQGSGYLSTTKIDTYQALLSVRRVAQRNPWLATCAKEFDLTNVSKAHSLLGVLQAPQSTVKTSGAATKKSKMTKKARAKTTPASAATSKKGGSGEEHGR